MTTTTSNVLKISGVILFIIILIFLYQKYFVTPKVYVEDIDSANKSFNFKVGRFGDVQSFSLSQIPQTGYIDEHGNATKGYEQKIKNGIMKIYYRPSQNAIKIETHDKNDEMFIRWVMIYLDSAHWEDSEGNHSKPYNKYE